MKVKQFAFVLPLCILAACTAQLDEPITQDKQEGNVALDTAFITPVVDPNSLVPGDPAAKVFEIQSGTTTEKADIDFNNQRFENKVATLNSLKVDRSGDTMTGQLIITPSTPEKALTATAGAGSDVAAIQCTGDGIGAGIAATGGANSGKGVVGIGGATDGIGVEGSGQGTGAGVRGQGNGGPGGLFIAVSGGANGITTQGNGAGFGLQTTGGSTGPGLVATNGTASTAAAPTKAGELQGYLHLSAPNPNAGIDPGQDAVYAGSVARARGRTFLGGAPPFSFIGKPLNFVAAIAVVGPGTNRVTMVHPMADLNYEVQLTVNGGTPYGVAETNIAGRTTTQFEFTVFNTTTGTAGVGAAEYVDIAVFGEQ